MRTKSINMIWIVVNDFKKAIKFYTETAGLKLVQQSEEWGWAELEGYDGTGTRLGIAQNKPEQQEPIQPGQNCVFTLTVDNLEQANQDVLKQGTKLIGEIIEIPGHVKMQTAKDPEGNIFQIVQDLSQEACATKKSCCGGH